MKSVDPHGVTRAGHALDVAHESMMSRSVHGQGGKLDKAQIQHFQMFHGLPVTGVIDEATQAKLDELEAQDALHKSRTVKVKHQPPPPPAHQPPPHHGGS